MGKDDYRNPLLNSYGYNVWGIGLDIRPYGLGLGAPPAPIGYNPVPASTVKQPSNLIAVGDSYSSGFLGVGRIDIIGDQPWIGNHLKGGNGQPDGRWNRLALERHRQLLNVAFCDGHAESIKVRKLLYETSDASLSRWNTDNESHIAAYR